MICQGRDRHDLAGPPGLILNPAGKERITMKRKPKPKGNGLRRVPRPVHPNQILLSVDQAALFMGVSTTTLRRLLNSGSMPSIMLRSSRSKRLIRVSKNTIEAWIAREEKRGGR